MLQREYEQEVALIRSLRRQGVLTPQEAYERHMSLAASMSRSMASVEPVQTLQLDSESDIPGLGWLLLGILVALAGGAFGIPGAFLQELFGGGVFFLAFTGAPIIEEALKPAGVYILLLRWPKAIAGQVHTAILSALGGLSFAIIESLVYVTVYYPDEGSGFVLFRFTVPVLMHCTCSFLLGLGLNQNVFDWAAGRASLAKRTRNFYFAAVGVHALYNLTATILVATDVINFD